MGQTEATGLAADAAPNCDRVDNDVACDKPAVWTYLWEWGASGVCCAEHGAALQQLQEPLGRRVTLAQIAPPAPAKLTRDERTLLIAAKLSAEAELEEVKQRGLDLYNENVNLTKQVQSHVVRGRERDAQNKDLAAQLAELRESVEVLHAEKADMADELGRLRTLAKFVDEATAPPAPAPVESRVDG